MTLEKIINKEIDSLDADLELDRGQVQAKLYELYKVCKACGEQSFEECKWAEIVSQMEDIIKQTRDLGDLYDKHYNKKHLLEKIMFKYNDDNWKLGETVLEKLGEDYANIPLEGMNNTLGDFMEKLGLDGNDEFYMLEGNMKYYGVSMAVKKDGD